MTDSSSLCEEGPELPGGGKDEAEVGGAGAHGPREVLRVVLHCHVEGVALQLEDLKRIHAFLLSSAKLSVIGCVNQPL